jgi:hypothetical protein
LATVNASMFAHADTGQSKANHDLVAQAAVRSGLARAHELVEGLCAVEPATGVLILDAAEGRPVLAQWAIAVCECAGCHGRDVVLLAPAGEALDEHNCRRQLSGRERGRLGEQLRDPVAVIALPVGVGVAGHERVEHGGELVVR